MKKFYCSVVCVFLSFMWISMTSAATKNDPATQKQKQQSQAQRTVQVGQTQVVRPKAGISWKEKVLMQREIQKRAEARRNALLRQAESERRKNPVSAPSPPPM